MMMFGRRWVGLIVVLALVMVPCGAVAESWQTEDPQIEAGSMIVDALVARPVGMVMSVTGLGLFIISSPFSALGGNFCQAWDTLVIYPCKFTFVRPLGDFEPSG